MSLRVTDEDWAVDAADEVQRRLASSQLELKPTRVEIYSETDAFDEEAWRLRLYLPRPQGRTWGSKASFDTRRAAVDTFDMYAAMTKHALDGRTIALVTTEEAPDEDVAEPEGPSDGDLHEQPE